MKTSHLVLIVAVLALIGGAVWYTRTPSTAPSSVENTGDMGEYAYTCTNNVSFVMSPSSDMSTITISPVAGSVYPPTSILSDSPTDTGRRFRGEEFEFHGQGETVTLYVVDSGTTYTCNPQPKPDEAPFNFGD